MHSRHKDRRFAENCAAIVVALAIIDTDFDGGTPRTFLDHPLDDCPPKPECKEKLRKQRLTFVLTATASPRMTPEEGRRWNVL